MPRSRRRPARRSLTRRPLLRAPLALTLLLVAACGPQGATADERTGSTGGMRPAEPPLVLVAPAVRQEMVQRLTTTAVVESELEVAVVPRATGDTEAVLAEEGDRVEAGDVLARLVCREQELARDEATVAVRDAEHAAAQAVVATKEARSRLSASQSALTQAERDHERDVSLAASGDGRFASVSAKAVEASALALEQAEQERAQAELAVQRAELDSLVARTAVERAELALARAEIALAERSIRAPFAGRVARRDLRVGQQATMGAPAFVLTDLDALRVVFHRPQRELGLFLAAAQPGQAGLELEATSDAWPGARFSGTIERVSPTIDAASGSFRVTARLVPEAVDGGGRHVRLVPGLLVRLSLVTDRRPDALAVPKRAVQREGAEAFVLAVEDGIVRRVPVTEGYADEALVELRFADGESLDAGAEVITVGTRDLENGSAVRVSRVAPETLASAERDAADVGESPVDEVPADEALGEGEPSDGEPGDAVEGSAAEGDASRAGADGATPNGGDAVRRES